MIQVVIFSFDRAMQLDLLIESIIRYDRYYFLDVAVVYSYSSDAYKKGYELLKKKYPVVAWKEEMKISKLVFNFEFNFGGLRNWFWWIKYPKLRRKKSNFKQILLKTIEETEHHLLMFLTDDSLFYKDIVIYPDCIQRISDTSEKTSFSLRHGANLEGGVYSIEKDVILWNVYANDKKTDWGIPFSVDGHIYLKSAIVPILKKTIFNNPNTLEGNICFHIKKNQLFPDVMANKESCLIGFELNRVQDVFPNSHLDISSCILNEYFINNYTLVIDYSLERIFRFHPQIKSVYVVNENEKIVLLSNIKN